MKAFQILFRVLAGVAGLAVGLATSVLPLLFISNEVQEAESAKQYGGHVSLFTWVVGSAIALAVVVLMALLSFALFQFAVTGNMSPLWRRKASGD